MTKKTVLITGASRGLGRELALTFARNSWDMIINGRDEASLSDTRLKILSANANCQMVLGDLTSDRTIQKISRIASTQGIDALINNAGIHSKKSFEEMSIDEFRKMIEINLIAPVHLIKTVYGHMPRGGLIVNVNSVAGLKECDSETAYCASKHGLRGFTSSFKYEANRKGIRLIDVYLGAMQTDMTRSRESYDALMLPSEVADFIFSLCKDRQSMRVDEVVLGRRKY